MEQRPQCQQWLLILLCSACAVLSSSPDRFDLHGLNHPAAALRLGRTPVKHSGFAGKMNFTFYFEGAVTGFAYQVFVIEHAKRCAHDCRDNQQHQFTLLADAPSHELSVILLIEYSGYCCDIRHACAP